MKNLFTSFSLLCLLIITGCNGTSGENENSTTALDDIVITTLSLVSLNTDQEAQQSFDSNSTIVIQASISDQNGDPISGQRVNFSADLGDLSVSSTLTDSSGLAEISISNEFNSLSAGTVTASIDELSASIDYEYISSATEPLSTTTLTSEILINGELSNRFKADESAQVVATLVDENNAPIANQIINITADVGELSSTSALTTDNGTASFLLSGGSSLGAGIITLSLADDSSINTQLNYEIVAADTVIEEEVRLGYFDENNEFIEGEIELSIDDNTISAGGTLGLSVALVDNDEQLISSPTAVSFSSNCVTNGNAIIDLTVFSIKGTASATYEDTNCAGINGTEDIIIASVTTNGITHTASQTIDITGEELGSIEFISAEPNSIVLKGSGGQETSILTFVVKSALGNVVAQQEVNFSLDTTVGGISLGRTSGLTNSQGQITTQVLSGTVPTTASVTAKATMVIDGVEETIQTQSSELSINTGLPEQTSITIAATRLNPEASTVGESSEIFVWLADSFNNPVPDGTPANFTTEGGTIDSQCTTVNGTCSVEWRATEPYLTDHRSTILVTTNGHETFFDTNGNNTFDDADGVAIINEEVSSGLNRHSPQPSGFIDMSEAWRDDNENNLKDDNETTFFDDNGDGLFSGPDGNFNGPQCEGALCDENAKIATIRKALVLIMSDANNPTYELSSGNVIYKDSLGNSDTIADIPDGDSQSFIFKFADSAMQTLPFGTVVSVDITGGANDSSITDEIANTAASGFREIEFVINNDLNLEGEEPTIVTLTISITTPNTGTRVYFTQSFTLL